MKTRIISALVGIVVLLAVLFCPLTWVFALVAAAAAAVLGVFVPGTLINLCGMATMRCRALMRPAMMILCALMGVSAAAGIILSGEKKK